MRTKAKPNSKVNGISCANAYRASVKSAATDLEGLVDAYGAMHISMWAFKIESDIKEHGDSIYNAAINSQLNALPLPIIRKQNRPENKRRQDGIKRRIK